MTAFAYAAVFAAAVVHLVNGLFQLGAIGQGGRFLVAPMKLVAAAVIIGFAALELVRGRLGRASADLSLETGGALSGFFGGLTGHQGALRGVVLPRYVDEKEAFIGTAAALALLTDASRLAVAGALAAGLI